MLATSPPSTKVRLGAAAAAGAGAAGATAPAAGAAAAGTSPSAALADGKDGEAERDCSRDCSLDCSRETECDPVPASRAPRAAAASRAAGLAPG